MKIRFFNTFVLICSQSKKLILLLELLLRWDASPLDAVPECMKVVFHALLELFNEMELLTAKEGESCFVPYVKQAVRYFLSTSISTYYF